MKNAYVSLLITSAILTNHGAVLAGNTNDLINQERLHSAFMVKEVVKTYGCFEQQKNVVNGDNEKFKEYQDMFRDMKRRDITKMQAQGFVKPAPKAVVFVSFSMPLLSLKQIIQDAGHYRIPVVMRGLYKGSFRETVEKIFDLVKESNRGGVLINPVWFRKYDIKAVPALIVSTGEVAISDICGGDQNSAVARTNKQALRKKEGIKSDIIYGNIPLKRALTIIAEQGDASMVAKDILHNSGAA